MKLRLTILLGISLLLCSVANAYSFDNETLKYVIQYKWGAIQKDSGDATLSLRSSGDRYYVTLTGKTRPWADKFFHVRDTLKSTIAKKDLRPLAYTRAAHEGGKYAKDVLSYSYSGNNVKVTCKRHKEKKGKIENSTNVLTANGIGYDMASIFYYLRSLNFETMKRGDKVTVNMFSGKKKELLTLTYAGVQSVKLRDGKSRLCYHVKFRFTSEGKKKSSEDINAWLSMDKKHIPLMLEGSLSIGKVRAFYVG